MSPLTAHALRCLAPLLAVLLMVPAVIRAQVSVRAEGALVRVETSTLSAVLDRGLLVSLVRKADRRELIRDAAGNRQALQLVYQDGRLAELGGEVGDSITCLQLSDRLVHVRINSWNGDGLIAVSADPESGDLLIEPSGYASRPGLRACRWSLGGIAPGLELVAPFFQGLRLPPEHPLVAGKRWVWPFKWEAGLVILQGEDGGCWVHCRDDRYRYKALQVGLPGEPRGLGFETEGYGPLERNLGAGGLTWRINVYQGDWQVPAARYRDWLAQAYHLERKTRPAWVDQLRLAVSWAPTDPALLEALARWVEPGRVLLHVPHWRTDGYDENYPNYHPSEEGRRFIERAKAMGFRVMPHFNSIDMDPSHPAFQYVRDFLYRDPDGGKLQGWAWYQGNTKPVPESNLALLRHRDKKVMVKVHPGLGMWRSILAENVQGAARELSLEVAFLDVTLCTWNIADCLVEGIPPTEGMKRLEELIGGLGEGSGAGWGGAQRDHDAGPGRGPGPPVRELAAQCRGAGGPGAPAAGRIPVRPLVPLVRLQLPERRISGGGTADEAAPAAGGDPDHHGRFRRRGGASQPGAGAAAQAGGAVRPA